MAAPTRKAFRLSHQVSLVLFKVAQAFVSEP